MSRSIFLVENVAGGWYVRTGSSNGQKISTNEDYSSPTNAIRAFVTEGKHQPFAGMVILIAGQKPTVIRAAQKLPEIDPLLEEDQRRRSREALAHRKG